jgi:hypothetical protein
MCNQRREQPPYPWRVVLAQGLPSPLCLPRLFGESALGSCIHSHRRPEVVTLCTQWGAGMDSETILGSEWTTKVEFASPLSQSVRRPTVPHQPLAAWPLRPAPEPGAPPPDPPCAASTPVLAPHRAPGPGRRSWPRAPHRAPGPGRPAPPHISHAHPSAHELTKYIGQPSPAPGRLSARASWSLNRWAPDSSEVRYLWGMAPVSPASTTGSFPKMEDTGTTYKTSLPCISS